MSPLPAEQELLRPATPLARNGLEASARPPLFYLGTSVLTYLIAYRIYDAPTARWSAILVGSLPGVSFSSRIVSTDVPLVFFSTLALLAYISLLRSKSWPWTFVLGLSLGLG